MQALARCTWNVGVERGRAVIDCLAVSQGRPG